MASKLRLAKGTSQRLQLLSTRLGLRRNVVCRIALGRSFANIASVADYQPVDGDGYEFNKYTLTGDQDSTFKALVVQHEGRGLTEAEYFQKFLRNHLERGINTLSDEYAAINSPIEFLLGLARNGSAKQPSRRL
jgi:DNA sulfur modification protein DndE